MTEQEKEKNPGYEATNGYLKIYNYKEAQAKAWESATDEDKKLLYALPNFNPEVFKDISGIDVNKEAVKEITVSDIEALVSCPVKIIKEK